MTTAETLPAFELRLARPEDRDFVVGLAVESFADLGDYRATIESWIAAREVASIVAVADGVPCGFALIAVRRSIGFVRRVHAELLAIAVEPGSRRRGIARRLLARAELTAKGFDAQEVRLHTAESNRAARNLFGAAGYVACGGTATSYPNGQRALELRRPLRCA